jgi:hypothetical protein
MPISHAYDLSNTAICDGPEKNRVLELPGTRLAKSWDSLRVHSKRWSLWCVPPAESDSHITLIPLFGVASTTVCGRASPQAACCREPRATNPNPRLRRLSSPTLNHSLEKLEKMSVRWTHITCRTSHRPGTRCGASMRHARLNKGSRLTKELG